MTYKMELTLDQFMKVNDKELSIVVKETLRSVEDIFNSDVTYGLVYDLTAIVQKEWFTVLNCESNSNAIYVFGDNLMRDGKGGQAIIRDCKNSFGVATKRFPLNSEEAYMNESYKDAVTEDLVKLHKLYMSGKTIIFPADGLGTGLAKLDQHAPELLQYINDFISHNFLMHNPYIR